MSELKQCPFCGGEAINDKDAHPIYCGACYSQMPYGVCEDDMVKLWNTRSDAWVSVDDRLPSVSGAYWTFNGGDESRSVIQQRVHMYDDNHKQFNSCTVTHWMPLPNPPKTDKQ